jgi:prevent-host-death family protein
MGKPWPVQDAKARFSAFLDASLKEGPQVVTRRGVAAAVLVPIEEWLRLKESGRPSLKDLLLAPQPRTDRLVAPRSRHRHRHRRPPRLA